MEPLSASGVKLALPALREAFKAVRRELARRPRDGHLSVRLGDIDSIMDEAIAVLARHANGIGGNLAVGVKGLISRPPEFAHEAPRRWIATELAQKCLLDAARAALRGEDDAPFFARAVDHYRSFLDEDGDVQPDAEVVFFSALDFILRSLKRELGPGQSILFAKMEAISDQIEETWPSETTDLVDERIATLVDTLRRTRFFRSADTQGSAGQLAEAVTTGRFRRASVQTRAYALAWCARVAAFEAPATAQLWLDQAQALAADPGESLLLARAFVAAADSWSAGLALLAPTQSHAQATAAFQIMRHGLGSQLALDRAATGDLTPAALDSDGRYALLATLVETDRWTEALDIPRTLVSEDFEQCPALMWLAASVLVASCLPVELRSIVLHDVPNSPQTCPLRDDGAGLEARRTARALMERLAKACDDLNLPREAAAASRYALWLRLTEPGDSEAIDLLRERFAEPTTAIAHLPLALGYGLDVDRERAARAIAQRLALEGETTAETMNALVALLVDRSIHAPASAATLLETFRVHLQDYVEPQSFLMLETRILVEAGQPEAARARLEAAPVALSESARALLDDMIGSQGAPPSIEALEALYRDNPQPQTLVQLIERLRARGPTPRYLELARILLKEMPTSEFANEIVGFLVAHGRDEHAAELLQLVGDLTDRSDGLLAHAAWLHFRRGALAEAETALARLEAKRDHGQDRELRLQLLISSGRWEALDGYLDRQWEHRAHRSARELARCSNLAAQIGAKRAMDFARAAVEAAPDDPHVLLAGYMAATTAGLEEDRPETSQWLMTAAALSDDTGPVQSASLETLLEGKDNWDERTATATNALIEGSAPLETIAAVVSKSWLELQLNPLVLNPAERDPRRVQLRALYSGRKRIEDTETIPASMIAVDASALITLSVIDALDALDHFEKVFVPHGLLSDLFEQRNRLSFHQPSRVAFSNRLLDMVADGKLRRFEATVPPDIALVTQIGPSRAAMLAEAAAQDGQHVYVHPYPIQKLGSLLSEPVSLDRYANNLVSCLGVVDLLARTGYVTAAEAADARRYLQLHDARWPKEPDLRPGAVLYLSELATDYLRHVGLLVRLAASGITTIVSSNKLEEARALRDTTKLCEEADLVITRLRKAIAEKLVTGSVILAPTSAGDTEKERSSADLGSLIGSAPVFVTDERFMNRHSRFDLEHSSHRILASFDLLALLANGGVLPAERVENIAVELRRRGVAFVPVNSASIERHMATTQLADGGAADDAPAIVETGELRALRENVRQIQLHGWFDRVHDTPWLVEFQSALIGAIKAQWNEGTPRNLARARSSWLYRLLDTRGWSETQVSGGLGEVGVYGSMLDIARLVSGAHDLSAENKAAYGNWLENDVLGTIWTREPGQRAILLNHLRGTIRAVAREMHKELGVGERLAAAHAFHNLPDFLQIEVLDDELIQDDVGYTLETRIEMAGTTFLRDDLLSAARKLYASPQRPVSVTDEQRRKWTLRTDAGDPHWPLLFAHKKKAMRVRGFLGLHRDAATRVSLLDAILTEQEIAPHVAGPWRDILAKRSLVAQESEELETLLDALPPRVSDQLQGSFARGSATISLLVPPMRAYWEHLAGPGGSATLAAHLETWRGPADWSAATPVAKASWSLLAASHRQVLASRPLTLSHAEWRELGKWVLTDADVLSMTGFIEAALPHAHADPELEEQILALVAKIESLDPEDEAGPLFLFSSLAIFVEGELCRAGVLQDFPPWHRRMAAMAHAALLARGTFGQINTERFAKFCLEQRGWRFALQTLVDMRVEPRWRADYGLSAQLRHEFLGRIFNAAATMDREQLTPALESALLAEKGSLRDRLVIPRALLPGPLEGAVSDELPPLAGEILTELEDVLCEDPVDVGLIRRLVNLEGVAKLPRDLCERATEKIRDLGARLLSNLATNDVYPHLLGLANLAASHRLPELAETVRMLVRLHRLRTPLSLQEELQIALHASAASSNSDEWRKNVGEWTREIAYRVEDRDGAETVLSWLDGLSEIEPQLHGHVARARALIRIWIDS